jgi:hypothetical protein
LGDAHAGIPRMGWLMQKGKTMVFALKTASLVRPAGNVLLQIQVITTITPIFDTAYVNIR